MTDFCIQVDQLPEYVSDLITNCGTIFWKKKLKNDNDIMLHMAVMVQPYLSRILNGTKTIESRYSVNMVSPYKKIKTGDIVLLKKSGGKIVALFEAGQVRFFQLSDNDDLLNVKSEYNDRLLIDDPFWEAKKGSRFATLIDIRELLLLPEFKISKKSRMAWMTLGLMKGEQKQMILKNYPPIVCIVGKIASGKTYVSKSIAEKKSYVRYSTSDYLKKNLLIAGILDPSREQLQKQGELEINRGWDIFAQSVLEHLPESNLDRPIIIDGVRHLQFYNAIKAAISPQKCTLIYLDIEDEIIQNRLIERNELDITHEHVAEGDLSELKSVADLISGGELAEIENHIDLFCRK